MSTIPPLINEDGQTFDGEIAALEPRFAALSNSERAAYRTSNGAAIARCTARRILVVAGPGAGKSFLFLERIRYWIDLSQDATIYVASFVRKLVADLQADVDQQLEATQAARVTVSTLHSLARSLVERNQGASTHQLGPHVAVISGRWSDVVWQDVLEFHPQTDRGRVSQRALETQFHTEVFSGDAVWVELRATYALLSLFYNAVGFADMIVLARQAVEENPDLVGHSYWIIDEYQDFNAAEDHLIRVVSIDAEGVLLAGDDDQALYQQLKSSLPDIIVSYYVGAEFANAMLPFCSRCSYYICLAASAFIAGGRASGGIKKIYLPLAIDEGAAKLEVVATATPTMAVDYTERFVAAHQSELEAHREQMEAGLEADPFLLILTPERKARFLRLGQADERLHTLVAAWSVLRLGHSEDYWKVVDYASVAWNPLDNFAVRKVLHHQGVTSPLVHVLLEQAI